MNRQFSIKEIQMAKTYQKKKLAPVTVREIKIKTKLRNHLSQQTSKN